MKQPKRVNKRGSRRSILLGGNDPRHRRDPAGRVDPRADEKAKELEARLKKLEES